MKNLFITLEVQDGEHRHTHRVLHISKGTDINFITQWYAAHYYGTEAERNGDCWEFQAGSIAVKVENVRELSEYEYDLMHNIFNGDVVKNYFEIIQAGYNPDSEREEVEINAGDNGKLMIVKTDEGFVVDVYGQNGHINTMAIWEEDMPNLY